MKLGTKLLQDLSKSGESEVIAFQVKLDGGTTLTLTGPDSVGADIEVGNGTEVELKEAGIVGVEKLKSGTAGTTEEPPLSDEEILAPEAIEEPEEDERFFGGIEQVTEKD